MIYAGIWVVLKQIFATSSPLWVALSACFSCLLLVAFQISLIQQIVKHLISSSLQASPDSPRSLVFCALTSGATKKGLKAERDSECDSRRCTSHFNFFQNLLKKLKMRGKSTVIGFYLHCSLDVSCASFVTVPIVPKITFHPFLSLVLSPDCITLRLDLWIMSGLALWPDRPRDRGDVFTHRHSCQ